MSERTRFVGLDVHKASITVAVAEAFGDPEDHGHIANDPSAVRRLVQRLGGPDLHLEIAYEAGPTGYALHRQLTAMGIACVVVAPSLIPVKPGDRIKTGDPRSGRRGQPRSNAPRGFTRRTSQARRSVHEPARSDQSGDRWRWLVGLGASDLVGASGVGHALTAYDMPIEGRDEWIAAAARHLA
jgi:hypothetical protein